MKTKLLIIIAVFLILSFRISSLAKADYTCTWYCASDDSSYTNGGYCSNLSAPADPDDPDSCSITCSGSACTTAPTSAPVGSTSCAELGGYYSGSFPCCSSYTACSDGTCETSCSSSSPTSAPPSSSQVCTPNATQYVCGSTVCP